jgi:hypothetical protein
MKNLLARLLMCSLAFVTLAVFSPVEAATIFVPNGDFETNSATRPGQTNSAPANWTVTNNPVFGTLKPTDLSYYDENNAGFVSRGHGLLLGFTQGAATFSQTLTDLFLPATTYTLSMQLGDSYESASGLFEIRLLSGSTVLATAQATHPGPAYTIVPMSLSFDTSTNLSTIGTPITIQLANLASGGSKTFDNVTLSSVAAIPEPGTYAMLGMSLLGLVGFRWRR